MFEHELESIINQKQNDLTTADSKWDSSGIFVYIYTEKKKKFRM